MSHICLFHSSSSLCGCHCCYSITRLRALSNSLAFFLSSSVLLSSFCVCVFKTPAHNRIIHFMKTHNQILNTPKYVTRILKSIYRPIFGPLIQTNANETVAIFQFKIWSTNELHINTRTFCFFYSQSVNWNWNELIFTNFYHIWQFVTAHTILDNKF